MSRLLQTAIACGAIPLTLGTAIYVAWRVANWDWLMAAGLFTVLGGLLLFAIGAGCLVVYVIREARNGQPHRIPLGLQSLLVGGLLLVNFPAAAYYAWSAVGLMTQFTVCVVNETGAVVDNVVLTGPGVHVETGPIPAGSRSWHTVHFSTDGTLEFAASWQSGSSEGPIEEYVTNGVGGDATLRLLPNGEYEIDRQPRWAD